MPTDFPHPDNEGQTHYDGCWRDRGHHNCAVQEVERLREALATAERRVFLAAADAVVNMAHKERALFGSGHAVDHRISVLVDAAEALREMADEVTDAD